MRKWTWAGMLLLVAGVAALVFASQLRSCVTDYDVTLCETSGIIGFNIAGVVLVVLGSALAIVGRRATPLGLGADTEEGRATP